MQLDKESGNIEILIDLEEMKSVKLKDLILEIRRKMLHNKRTPDIKEQLRFLKDNGICFHTQIVVCPGYNDAEVLDQTIRDLLSYESSLLSIALVPVGLTRTH